MADSTKFTHIGNVIKNIRREAFGPDLSVDAVAKIITDVADKNPIEEHGPKPFKCSKNVIYKIESGATSVPSKEFLDYFCLATMIQDTYEPFLRRLYESYVNFEWMRHETQPTLLDLMLSISIVKISEAWFFNQCTLPPIPSFKLRTADIVIETLSDHPDNQDHDRGAGSILKIVFMANNLASQGISYCEHRVKERSIEMNYILYFNRVAAFTVSATRQINMITDDTSIRTLLQHTHPQNRAYSFNSHYIKHAFSLNTPLRHRNFYLP
jgi:hypothetical protein